jgi:hypothetical protein
VEAGTGKVIKTYRRWGFPLRPRGGPPKLTASSSKSPLESSESSVVLSRRFVDAFKRFLGGCLAPSFDAEALQMGCFAADVRMGTVVDAEEDEEANSWCRRCCYRGGESSRPGQGGRELFLLDSC